MSKPRAARVTNQPELPPPVLYCPSCSHQLTFMSTVINGVRPIEYWDRFACAYCGGDFEYRRRTRRLRRVN
jgi:hypothetical protein